MGEEKERKKLRQMTDTVMVHECLLPPRRYTNAETASSDLVLL